MSAHKRTTENRSATSVTRQPHRQPATFAGDNAHSSAHELGGTAVASANAWPDSRISEIEAFTVELPLPRPLQLGAMTIRNREYVVIRIRTSDGLEGNAFGLSRSTPVAETVRNLLTPLLLDAAADTVAALWDKLIRSTAFGGRVGTIMRAISLIDIALWDIKGKRSSQPVWRLLGGGDPDVACVLVAGYPTGEPPEAVGSRVAKFAHEGHHLLKVARLLDPNDTQRLLRQAANELPLNARLVVDAAWWWRTSRAAADEICRWVAEAPLAWVEDPLVPEDVDGYRRLVASRVAPIGAGDELTDRYVARALLQHAQIDVLRLDALAIGGITGAWQVAHWAAAFGIDVSYHIYPEVHIHLAAGGAIPGYVETFGPADNPFDPAATLYEGGPSFTPGRAVAPERPGLGFTIDFERALHGSS